MDRKPNNKIDVTSLQTEAALREMNATPLADLKRMHDDEENLTSRRAKRMRSEYGLSPISVVSNIIPRDETRILNRNEVMI
jgi:hypothetical protein